MDGKVQRCLVLPSALILLAFGEISCADNKDRVRNSYASKEDCMKDNDPRDCEADSSRRTISGGHAAYWGPWYSSSLQRSFSSNASGVVNQGGDFMPASQAKAASPSAFANFSTSGAGSTAKATGTSYSRGGFGSTARAGTFSGG